jgi:hypothetical protein
MIIAGGEKMGQKATVLVLLSYSYSIPVLVSKMQILFLPVPLIAPLVSARFGKHSHHEHYFCFDLGPPDLVTLAFSASSKSLVVSFGSSSFTKCILPWLFASINFSNSFEYASE